MSRSLSDGVLRKNVSWAIDDVVAQITLAERVRGRARTTYYKAAILQAAAIVEALLHDYLKTICTQQPQLLNHVTRFKTSREATSLVQLPAATLGTTKELWVCEIKRSQIDRMSSFKDMNDLALEIGVISQRLYGSLEYVRNKRNEIHLQTLSTTQRRYNNQILERVSGVMLQILTKIKNT